MTLITVSARLVRASLLTWAFFSCAETSRTTLPSPSPLPATASDALRSPADHRQVTCIVNPHEKLTILHLIPTSDSSFARGAGDVVRSATQGFVNEARAQGLALSSYSSDTLGERTLGGCAAFLLDPAVKVAQAEDIECMTRVAERLNTEWLLSGIVSHDQDGFVVEVQLVRAYNAHAARVVTFRVENSRDARTDVAAAWIRLTSSAQE